MDGCAWLGPVLAKKLGRYSIRYIHFRANFFAGTKGILPKYLGGQRAIANRFSRRVREKRENPTSRPRQTSGKLTRGRDGQFRGFFRFVPVTLELTFHARFYTRDRCNHFMCTTRQLLIYDSPEGEALNFPLVIYASWLFSVFSRV